VTGALEQALRRASQEAGWSPPRPLLELVAEALADAVRPRVAVVSRATDHALPRVLKESLPDVEATLLSVVEGRGERHLALAAAGPMDLIVDLAGGAGAPRRYRAQLFHLRVGGTMLTRIPRSGALLRQLEEVQELRASDALRPPTRGHEARPMPERDRHAFAASFKRLEVRGGFVVSVSGVSALAKVRESDANTFLELRPEAGRVIELVPGVSFDSECSVATSAEAGPPVPLPSGYDAPDVSLRQYLNVVCRPRQVVTQKNVVLPASYRHNAKPRLRNQALIEWAPDFVLHPDGKASPLEGDFFYLDNQHRGHFGHALTEQISHLWGWRRAQETFPDLRALVFEWPDHPIAEWEYLLLEAGGIPRHQVHVAREPVAVDSLVVASPMFSMPDFVHPRIRETYRAVGDELEKRGTVDDWPGRIFCSRRGRRSGHNKAEIEQAFRDEGFTVMYPEELALGDQVRLVRRAEVIAGFSGSGMFQIAFAAQPKHVILVGSESYTGTNEYMISSVLGHRLDIVLCRPDIPRAGRFTPASYHSNFTYDPDREGKFLRAVLAGL
jgi:capsular polysaccharide biosynthesis protein